MTDFSSPNTTKGARFTSTERVRRHRRRRARGLVVLGPLAVYEHEIRTLADHGLLDPAKMHSRPAVMAAVGRLLGSIIGSIADGTFAIR